MSFSTFQVPTAAELNALLPLRVRKNADEVLISTAAVQNDNELALSIAASTTYKLWLMAVITTASSTTPDFRSGFTYPAGATFTGNVYGLETAATSAAGSANYAGFLNAASPINTPRGLASGSNIVFLWEGVLIVGGTAGTLQFQWSQNVSTAENTTVKAGSELILTVVS